MNLTLLTDVNSWKNSALPVLALSWQSQGHQVRCVHSLEHLPEGDLCFVLGFLKRIPASYLARHRHNLIVHESDLPLGRGWSPFSWQILKGHNEIPICLFEAVEEIDAGPVYLRTVVPLSGHELLPELRSIILSAELDLCRQFVKEYPGILQRATPQSGEPTSWPRRTPADSRLDPERTLADQFNLLRIVDNERYPAYFDWRGHRYRLRIDAVDPRPDGVNEDSA